MFQSPKVNYGRELKQILVPNPLRGQVMKIAHDSIFGGHLGIQKTLDKIRSNFYWPGMNGDVQRYCQSCDICQKTIRKGDVRKVPLDSMPLIDVPFKRVAVDLVGPITPMSNKGNRFILTLVDYATRFPEAVALREISSENVAEALVSMFSRVGVPEEILSDCGSQFTADLMKEVSRLLSIKQLTTTPYHPQCNGLVEKFNGTLKTMLKRLCNEQPQEWDRYLEPALFAYREVPQASLGFSPFELLFGRTVRGPMHILKQLWAKDVEEQEVRNSYQYVTELRERLDETCRLAQEELGKAQQRQKHYYNVKSRVRKLKKGEKVLLLLPTDHNKLLMQWKGPFEVVDVLGHNDYKVQLKNKTKVYHVNMLKRYVERPNEDHDVDAFLSDSVFQVASTAIIEQPDPEDLGDGTVNDEELLVCPNLESKE